MSSLDYLDDFFWNDSELFWLEINYSLVIVSTYPKRCLFCNGEEKRSGRVKDIFDL
jgi:hypothetical protein